jgi:phenylacetate-CoA ligase
MLALSTGLENLERDRLEQLQLERLSALVERVYRDSGYYRRLMDSENVKPGDITSLDAFRDRFPFSTKKLFLDDQQTCPPFGERLSVPREKVALINLTGGTSGQGQEAYGRTQADVHTLGYLHAFPWARVGLRPGHTMLNCVPTGGMTTGGWGPSEGIRIAGATGLTPPPALSTEAKIELMLRFRPIHFIYASTNFMHRLTEALVSMGHQPREAFPDLAGVFIAAEGYPDAWAERVQDLWGCTLHEGYGSTQCVGFAAATGTSGVIGGKGQRGVMDFFEWMTFCEVVNPETGLQVESGEEGELVVTNLTIEASPVIRFRTGDRVRFVDGRTIGQTLHGMECGGIGRFDDMMKIRGNNVWPDAVDASVFSFPEVAEYVGRVFTGAGGRTECELSIALRDIEESRRETIGDAISNAVKVQTNVSMKVVFVERSDLPEFTYKARRWNDERQQGYRL